MWDMQGVRAVLHNGTTLEKAGNFVEINKQKRADLTYEARDGNKIWILFATHKNYRGKVYFMAKVTLRAVPVSQIPPWIEIDTDQDGNKGKDEKEDKDVIKPGPGKEDIDEPDATKKS